ncbi:MAG: penicillin-binding protein 2, partial [Candidatus Omnitrophica bacterium]|nr:penicillin-binding protein 2 [Candidatus Omnitrophota bacterium]
QLIRVIQEKVPEPGEDLTTTLDLEFQSKIAELIKGQRAAVAVLDLETEGLLALASSPSYDPNVFVAPGQDKERLSLLYDKTYPMLDRGVSSAYPPGSVFKLVTALAALETGKITPFTRFYCPGWFQLKKGGRKFHCWNESGHGSINLYEAIERSCNVYFYNLGARLSPDEIARYARMLGLGEEMRLEVSNISPGLIPDIAWKKERYHEKWYQGETLSFAIGQSYVLTSPVQILRLVSIIAKGGLKVDPRLILDDEKSVDPKRVAIKPENLEVIRRAMLEVVQSQYGTGQLARVDFDKLAGKTGTAQAPPKKAHSWMTGFFPYDKPEIAFVVFVEHGGSGGITSARIVKSMLEIWSEHAAQFA